MNALGAAIVTLAAPSHEATPADARRSAITSQGYVTWIYARPRVEGRFLGYVRNGSAVSLLREELVPGEGCPGGFFAVAPRGFVCNDRTVTRAPSARRVETTAAAAVARGPLPFGYAFSDGAPKYNRIPSAAEQARAERGFGPAGDARRPYERPSTYQDLATLAPIAPRDPVPSFLADGGTAAEGRLGLVKETLLPGSIVSFTKVFAAEGRTWLLSADQALVPADRVRAFVPSTFHGTRLGGEVRLPIAWMRHAQAPRHRLDAGGVMETIEDAAWPARSFAELTGGHVDQGGERWLETTERDALGNAVFVRASDATVVEAARALPTGVKPGQKWIHVSIGAGTLVAYEDLVPVFATLISPGRGGVPSPGGDAVRDSTTPLGAYAITFKDRAASMSPDSPGGPRTQSIADVPHVQYFKAPFALHGAVWHERFGEPASAGCINASPLDADALFAWTDPPVPDEWQGATGAGAPSVSGPQPTTVIVVTR